jgi:hypothetical protein
MYSKGSPKLVLYQSLSEGEDSTYFTVVKVRVAAWKHKLHL